MQGLLPDPMLPCTAMRTTVLLLAHCNIAVVQLEGITNQGIQSFPACCCCTCSGPTPQAACLARSVGHEAASAAPKGAMSPTALSNFDCAFVIATTFQVFQILDNAQHSEHAGGGVTGSTACAMTSPGPS
jgi:hypothetical protein